MTKKIMNAWTFGGVRLSSFGEITELDSYLDLPAKRNENILIPMQDGNTHVKKFFEQKTVSFGIEIVSDGVCDLEETMDALKMLLGQRGQQYLTNPMFTTGERRALAEVVAPLGVTRKPDPRVARVVIDFLLAEPFMRDVTQYAPAPTVIGGHNTPATIVNSGTAEERWAIITLTGPLENVVYTNSANGLILYYTGVIAGGSHVDIDCGAFTALYDGAVNVLGNLTHVGDTAFMVFVPGPNLMDLDDLNIAGGDVGVTFYPPFL
jgi:hypothetical protein